jgi:hypothetical protein
MARDFRAGSFLSSESVSAEDADPRIGLVNLADVMLVFACGLMLALVTYWNLDVSAMQEIIQTQDVTEVSDIAQMEDQIVGGGSGYQELGMVYQDPMTGKLYMLSENLVESAPGTGENAAGSSSDVGENATGASPETGSP